METQNLFCTECDKFIREVPAIEYGHICTAALCEPCNVTVIAEIVEGCREE